MRKYQLALQFPGRSGAEYDTMVALEAALTSVLADRAEVDGHDVGAGTMNLFISTDDPQVTFEQVKPVLERRDQLEWVTAACREVDLDHYTVIWPPDCRKEFKL